jgi:hypothetical protein
MAEIPRFEDLREMLSPDVGTHQQECMDRYYDQLKKALPRQSLKALLRQFDSYWLDKAEALADAAFIYGFLAGRRMVGYLDSGSGSDAGEDESDENKASTEE